MDLSVGKDHETRQGTTRKEKDVKEVDEATEHMWNENEKEWNCHLFLFTDFDDMSEKK